MGYWSEKKLKIPYYPTESKGINQYTVSTAEEKIIADYANISIFDVYELNLIEYMTFLRDAVIYNNMQTESGREWLDNAWILEQKRPDRKQLRDKFSKK